MDFEILESFTRVGLEAQINQKISEGFIPSGSMVVVLENISKREFSFYQAMIKKSLLK